MLSIIIITCNRSQELRKSIISCQERISIDHEFIIIDNGSTDDTEDIINELIKNDKYPIIYLYQEENLGVSGGRNEGYRNAHGDICYFIDDDATVISDGLILDEAYNYMLSNPRIFAMGTDCYDTVRKKALRGLHEKGHSDDLDGEIRGYIGCSHFVRKHFDGNNYLYPSNLFYGAEELYVGLNTYRCGGCVWYYSGLKILHQPSSSTRNTAENNKRNGHINTFLIKRYFLPSYLQWISSILFFLRIIRFEKYNLERIRNCYHLVDKRTDKKYSKKLNIKDVLYLCNKFGFKNIF